MMMARSTDEDVRRRSVLLGAVALIALAQPSLAEAQENSGRPGVSRAPGEEIVVTAQRRQERLEDVPMAITALSPETLENAGVVSFQDLGAVAAGAQVNYAGVFAQPAIRGVTTLTNGNNIENNVAVYVDGFYIFNPLILSMDLPNISSIEVLKGPQGTLYGRNATGGAILINTLAPSETLTGRAEITYARFNDKRANAYLSGPLTSGIRVGVSGYYRRSDSYVKLADPNVVGQTAGPASPITQGSLRAKVEADLTDDITATLGYDYTYVDDPRNNNFSSVSHLAPAIRAIQPPLRITEPGTAAYNWGTEALAKMRQGTLKLAWDTGIGTLSSYTGYMRAENINKFDTDGTYVDLSSTFIHYKQKNFQQAVDFTIDAIDDFDLVVGGLYYWDDLGPGPDGISAFGLNRQLQIRNLAAQETSAWAVYADATVQVTEALSITAGGRYSDEKKQVDFTSLSYVTNPAGVPTLGPLTREANYSKFTPRASIRYEIAPRTNIYASFSKGFRSGAFSLSPPAVASEYRAVRPETIDAWEIGFKTASRWLQFDVAGFYYDYKDLHVNTLSRSPLCPPLPTQCGLFITVFQNAPKAEIYGLDSQVTVTPLENLNIRAGVSVLHGRYKNFPNATGTGLNIATDTNVGSQQQDWSGQQMVRAPDFSGNFGVDYNVPIGEGGVLFAANASFTDSYVVNNLSLFGPLAGDLANQQRYRQGGYALLNANITWTDPSGHYHIGVFGRNLTDHRYRIAHTGNVTGDYGTYGEPFTFGVRAGLNF
jgi:iron complex outermembrane receptor protein